MPKSRCTFLYKPRTAEKQAGIYLVVKLWDDDGFPYEKNVNVTPFFRFHASWHVLTDQRIEAAKETAPREVTLAWAEKHDWSDWQADSRELHAWLLRIHSHEKARARERREEAAV